METITEPIVRETLEGLHRQADKEFPKILKGLSKGIFRKLQPEDMKDTFIAISRQQGAFLYDLLVSRKAQHLVEFGTSLGISTLYLAAAAKVTGGSVITTELLPSKCARAAAHFEQAQLTPQIDLREGDALETLATNVADGIDFLLLDGWNDLYLPILKLLEPKFKRGTLIYTDNASFKSAKPFLQYIHAHPSKYASRRLQDDKGGSELTEFIG